ncbi:MAG: nucleoside hydrolase [Erysipelotrichaceae bacterium]|nr:nucleoside hydrolase [Erysipelotrichaceae bacterium]
MKKIPVWIDCDTGVDDSMALMIALRLEELEVVGISAVAGNVGLEHTFKNTRDVVTLAGSDVKVYPGAAKPWIKPYVDASFFHGSDGLGGVILEESKAAVETEHAWDALYKAAKEYNGELRVVAVGPLTNIATAVAKYPDLPQYVKEICIMGGAVIGGNTTPWSEFNIECDPHAAQAVFKSGIHVVMFGLDVTMKAYLTGEEVEELASYDNPAVRLIEKANQIGLAFNESIGRGRLVHMHDSCPVLYLAHPELFKGQDANVHVETRGFSSNGKTVTDLYSLFDSKKTEKNSTVMLEIDREKTIAIIKEIFKKY